jgi:hypothetical protein
MSLMPFNYFEQENVAGITFEKKLSGKILEILNY